MDPEYSIPGLGTYAAPGWGGSSTTEPTYSPPSGEATAGMRSPSQVPGTSGAPIETASRTPGGISSGSGQGTAGTPWGSLAGLLGLGGGASGASPAGGNISPQQRGAMALQGMRMLQPQGNPMRPGAPPSMLSAAGQNPMIAQYMQMFGVDYNTALAMMTMLHPGGTTMTPAQQAQNVFGGGAFMPPATPAQPPSPLLPSSAMPTAAEPYTGRPATPMTANLRLPMLGQGAFMPGGATPQPISSQMLYGSFA